MSSELREKHVELMKECLADAEFALARAYPKLDATFQLQEITTLAAALYQKRARHRFYEEGEKHD